MQFNLFTTGVEAKLVYEDLDKSKACDDNNKVVTIEECTKAGRAVGLGDSITAKKVGDPWQVKRTSGCYIDTGNNRLYFNPRKNGDLNFKEFRAVCKKYPGKNS